MSFSVTIFRREVMERVNAGAELDAFEHPAFTPEQVAHLITALGAYKYVEGSGRPGAREFTKRVHSSVITAALYSTELSISVPYGDSSEDAIFEVLQDAAEMADPDTMAVWDPESGHWVSEVA